MSSSSSSTSYRSLFETPAQVAFVLATFLGRVPISMKALGAILLIQQTTGSYSLAGLVGATQTLVAAFASPQLGRLMDRIGPKPVILWTAIAHLVGMVILIVAAEMGAHWSLILLGAAIVGGSSVQFGSLSRARWVTLLGKGPRLDKAYALEAMADEIGFIIGPLIVVPLAVSVGASIALLVALAFTLFASVILVVQRAPQGGTAVSLHPSDTPDTGRGVMTIRGMQVLAASLLFLGVVFGAVEIVLVAFAEANGWPGAASIMASTFAFGSLLGAVIYGAITWRMPVDQRLKLALIWFTLGTIPMFLSTSIWQMTAAIFLTGLGISPALIAINGVVENLAPPRSLTEAFTWVGSALATGAAMGSLIIGIVLDEMGLRSGQSVGVIGSLISLIIIYAFGRYLIVSRPGTRVS
jgi:MFS family permease